MRFSPQGLIPATGTLTNQMLVNSTLQSGKVSYFYSQEQTGTGSEQTIEHNLGRTPDVVLVIPSGTSLIAIFTSIHGTHDPTKIKVTVSDGQKYRIFAF